MAMDLKDRDAQWADEQEKARQLKEESKSLVVVDEGINSMLMDSGRFAQAQRAANLLASSDLVPEHFRNKPGNCFIGLQLAHRLGVDVFMVLQNLYVVYGTPGIAAKLKISLANGHGPFDGPIQWELKSDQSGRIESCKAYATMKSNGQPCEYTLTRQTVESMGWTRPKKRRDGKGEIPSMWTTMPEKMYRYRSASWMIDLCCPEVVMGLPSADELMESPKDGSGGIIEAEWSQVSDEQQAAKEDPNADVPTDWPAKDQPAEQEEIKTKHGSTITDKTGEADASNLDLGQLIADATEAGMPPDEIDSRLHDAEIVQSDGRTHTEKRLQKFAAAINDWLNE